MSFSPNASTPLNAANIDISVSLYQRIKVRTTVTLDDDVYRAAQAQARAAGKNLGEVLSQLARRGLQATAKTVSKNGLPVFKVPEDSPVIPSGRAHELLAEDAM